MTKNSKPADAGGGVARAGSQNNQTESKYKQHRSDDQVQKQSGKQTKQFINNQIAIWKHQFSGRKLTCQQSKFLSYLERVDGRGHRGNKKKVPPSPHVFDRKEAF